MSALLGSRLRLAALVGVAALWSLSAGTSSSAEMVRTVEISPIAIYWPSFVADANGLYAKHGVETSVTYVPNDANSLQQLVAGEFDIALSGFDNALRAAGKGADIRLIGATALRVPTSAIAAIKDPSELAGKTFTANAPEAFTNFVWKRWLKRNGVDPTSVDSVFIPTTPQRYAALKAGAVQVALLGSPFDFKAVEEGYIKLYDVALEAPEFGFIAMVASPKFLAEHPDAVRGYLAAQAEAVEWLYDPANREAAAKILSERTKLEMKYALLSWDYYFVELQAFNRGLEVPEEFISREIEALVEAGSFSADDVIPASYRDMRYLPDQR